MNATVPRLTVEPLGSHHDRAGFECGNAAFDDFIRTKARKEHELGFSTVFIAVAEADDATIWGYYCLSAHSIVVQGIPLEARKRFPRYPVVPSILLGRLARAARFHRQRVGEFLLVDALRRALVISEQVGAHAVVVDAIDAAAALFYGRFEFLQTNERADRLYMPVSTIKRLGF